MHEATASTIPLPDSRDALAEILRQGARSLLAQAVEAEVADWIEQRAEARDAAGRRQVVRNGHSPERKIVTSLGPIEVEQPRVRDRRPEGEREKKRQELRSLHVAVVELPVEADPLRLRRERDGSDRREAIMPGGRAERRRLALRSPSFPRQRAQHEARFVEKHDRRAAATSPFLMRGHAHRDAHLPLVVVALAILALAWLLAWAVKGFAEWWLQESVANRLLRGVYSNAVAIPVFLPRRSTRSIDLLKHIAVLKSLG